jgi:hypothetical protein
MRTKAVADWDCTTFHKRDFHIVAHMAHGLGGVVLSPTPLKKIPLPLPPKYLGS